MLPVIDQSPNNLPGVSERLILLVSQIHASKGVLGLHRVRNHPCCVALLIVSPAKHPPSASRDYEQEPGDDRRDDSREVPRRMFPKLWRSDASGTVTNKEDSICHTAFGVSFYVRCTQTEQHRPWRGNA